MNFTNLFSAAIASLLFTSCTEIIDISTNAAEPQLVVEASIALNENATVILSKTANLDQPNNFEMVSDAQVRITDNDGKTELLTETNKGIYTSNVLKGENGKSYTLRIESGDKLITSQCKIPDLIPIDSFKVVNSVYPGGGPPKGNQPAPFYEIKLKYSDPVNQQNFYRIVLYYNGKVQDRNNISSDKFTDGKQMESSLVLYNDSAKAGDKISVEFQCIDKSVYNYFESMGNSAMGPRSASSPANPYTNLNGAILGYFSAHTVERKEWVVN